MIAVWEYLLIPRLNCPTHPFASVIVYRRSAFAFADKHSSDAKREDWLPQLQE